MIINVLNNLYWYTKGTDWSYRELLNPEGKSFTKLREEVDKVFQANDCSKKDCIALKKVKSFMVVSTPVLAAEYSTKFKVGFELKKINHIFLMKLTKEQAVNIAIIPRNIGHMIFNHLKPLYQFIDEKKIYNDPALKERMPALIKNFSLQKLNIHLRPQKPNTSNSDKGNQMSTEQTLNLPWWFQQIL